MGPNAAPRRHPERALRFGAGRIPIAMLRISQAGGDTGERVLRLEGELKGPWVNELRRISWDAATGNGTRADGLVVDLADVLFIGAEGLALLRELVGRHVRLRNGSPFVTEQLRETGNGDR